MSARTRPARRSGITLGLIASVLTLAPGLFCRNSCAASGRLALPADPGTGQRPGRHRADGRDRAALSIATISWSGKALTNEEGKFVFDRLTPDLYSIRVTLASFVPAMRRNIAVAAGSENLLQINLATLLSQHRPGFFRALRVAR